MHFLVYIEVICQGPRRSQSMEQVSGRLHCRSRCHQGYGDIAM